MELQFQPRISTIVAVLRKPVVLCCFLRRSGAPDLDFSRQVCDTLRPISRTVVGKLPPPYGCRRYEEKPDAPH
jgi:hypothetical protein